MVPVLLCVQLVPVALEIHLTPLHKVSFSSLPLLLLSNIARKQKHGSFAKLLPCFCSPSGSQQMSSPAPHLLTLHLAERLVTLPESSREIGDSSTA